MIQDSGLPTLENWTSWGITSCRNLARPLGRTWSNSARNCSRTHLVRFTYHNFISIRWKINEKTKILTSKVTGDISPSLTSPDLREGNRSIECISCKLLWLLKISVTSWAFQPLTNDSYLAKFLVFVFLFISHWERCTGRLLHAIWMTSFLSLPGGLRMWSMRLLSYNFSPIMQFQGINFVVT